MASIRYYPNGAGGTTGSDLAILEPGYMSGNRWYVGNGGTDAASPEGQERVRPLLTLAQAYTNAAAGDTIVLLANYTLTLAATQIIAKARLRIVGEGTGSTAPRITCAAGAANMLDITAAGVWLDNIYFPASTGAITSRVRVGAAGVQCRNLTFDCGINDTGRSMTLVTGCSQFVGSNLRFTATADAPAAAIEVLNAVTDVVIDRLILDAGSFRWTTQAFRGAAAITGLVGTRWDLLNGSDVILATGTTGELFTGVVTGSSIVDWTP